MTQSWCWNARGAAVGSLVLSNIPLQLICKITDYCRAFPIEASQEDSRTVPQTKIQPWISVLMIYSFHVSVKLFLYFILPLHCVRELYKLLKNSFINTSSLSPEFFESTDRGMNACIRLMFFLLLGHCRHCKCLGYFNIPVMCYGLMWDFLLSQSPHLFFASDLKCETREWKYLLGIIWIFLEYDIPWERAV